MERWCLYWQVTETRGRFKVVGTGVARPGREFRKVPWRLGVLGERRNQFGPTARCGPSSPGGALPPSTRRQKRSVLF